MDSRDLFDQVDLTLQVAPPGRRDEPRRVGLATLVFEALGRPVLSRLLVIFFLAILAFAGMEATFAMWAMREYGWGPAQVGYVFTYVGILSAVMQGGAIKGGKLRNESVMV